MSGKGKGGKGLTRGGAMSQHKVTMITSRESPSHHQARCGGVKRISSLIHEETHSVLKVLLENVIHYAGVGSEEVWTYPVGLQWKRRSVNY